MDDVISRQGAIDTFEDTTYTKNEIRRRITELPPAYSERETVKCVIGGSCMDIGDADFSMKCAKCGAEYYHVEDYDYDYNFCPNCGRRWER